MHNVKGPNLEWPTVAWANVSLTIVMQLELSLQFSKAGFKGFKYSKGFSCIFTLLLRMGGWEGGDILMIIDTQKYLEALSCSNNNYDIDFKNFITSKQLIHVDDFNNFT